MASLTLIGGLSLICRHGTAVPRGLMIGNTNSLMEHSADLFSNSFEKLLQSLFYFSLICWAVCSLYPQLVSTINDNHVRVRTKRCRLPLREPYLLATNGWYRWGRYFLALRTASRTLIQVASFSVPAFPSSLPNSLDWLKTSLMRLSHFGPVV